MTNEEIRLYALKLLNELNEFAASTRHSIEIVNCPNCFVCVLTLTAVGADPDSEDPIKFSEVVENLPLSPEVMAKVLKFLPAMSGRERAKFFYTTTQVVVLRPKAQWQAIAAIADSDRVIGDVLSRFNLDSI